jgi:hypothetical protein
MEIPSQTFIYLMATARRILIKKINKDLASELIKKNYPSGRTAILDYEYREVFLDKQNYTFIIFDSRLEDWIELDLDFNKSVDEHDSFLIRISRDYNTTVLFGYSQTTTGDTRFLALKNGQIIRSIYQKPYYQPDQILMESNFGEKLTFEKDFQYPELGQSIQGFKFLDFYDDIQKMFLDYGYRGDVRKDFDEKYLHVEYLR